MIFLQEIASRKIFLGAYLALKFQKKHKNEIIRRKIRAKNTRRHEKHTRKKNQKKFDWSLRIRRSGVRVPSGAPKVCDKKNVTGFFLCCIAQNQRSRRPIFKVRFIEMSNRFQAVGLFCWAAWCEFSLPCRPVLQFFSGIFNFFLLFSECFQFPRSQFLIGCGDFLLI